MVKALKVIKLLFLRPREFWCRLQPYFFRAKSGNMLINGINFEIDLNLDPAMERMYHGIYEPNIVNLLKNNLKEGDTFLDIGGNVGYISAYALGLVGTSGSVHAFEPVPNYYKKLCKVKKENPKYKLFVNNVALGEKKEKAQISITNLQNIGWNTMVPNFMSVETTKKKIDIDVIRLTDYLISSGIKEIKMIKIDTEGFEFFVMKGFEQFLREKSLCRPAIIMEIAPEAYPKMNISVKNLFELMNSLGYSAYDLCGKNENKLDNLISTTNLIFLAHNQDEFYLK